jgi:dTMP kinase
MSERGLYFVLEGGDGTGKTTQTILLDKHIRSLGGETLQVFNDETNRMEPLQEPGGTPRANELRRKIKDSSIERTPWQNVEWFTEARVILNEELIQPALEKGIHVLCARNWFSTVAYQGYGQGIPIDEIEDYTRQHVGEAYMTPDFAAILALKSERARRQRLDNRLETNVQKDTFESLPAEFQNSMQLGYVRFAEDRGLLLIDADGTQNEVLERIVHHADPLLRNFKS